MSETTDLIEEANAHGLRLTFADSPEFEVLIVGAGETEGDLVLATANWLEPLPGAFPLHRYPATVTETPDGWQLTDLASTIRLDRINDGMPEIQATYDAYRRQLEASARSQGDLAGIIEREAAQGGV